jgi:hypothetical protein
MGGTGTTLSIRSTNYTWLSMYKVSGQSNFILGWDGTSGGPRWRMALGDATPETGADVGSDFSINRYSDTGGFYTPLAITRASGDVTVEHDPTQISPR